ncbi:hypothetical protein [Sporosarcina sp. A2]|uniref:hypothetical protein n=1 Tax=Sporosarcina sp. A2 TaxID=3393449 RepID=UPI003D7B40D5
MDNSALQKTGQSQLPIIVTEEVHSLKLKVKDLEEEVSELKKDLHAIDLLQKKPLIASDTVAIGGFWIVAALVVIGIFFI